MMSRNVISFRGLLGGAILLTLAAGNARAQTKTVAERLGYPSDAKLLIVHADDLGVAHSVDRASFVALEQKAASSASVIVPGAWLTEVAAYAKQNPDADLGLHLALTSEWKTYRWGPVVSRDLVPGLLDPDGYLWPDAVSVTRHAKPEEVGREIRAQVERALKLGIRPTHLDTHMGTLAATPAFFAVLARVAHEYGLPFLAVRRPDTPAAMLAPLTEKDIILDSLVAANPKVRAQDWKDFYARALRKLKPGLTQMIVHLGYDDAELGAITVDHNGWWDAAWRQRDFDVVTSPEFKRTLEESHIILVRWKDLKKLQ